MTTLYLAIAALIAALTFAAHVFVGGPKNAAPVLTQPNLPLGPKTTMQFSWNAASLLLLSIAAGFALAALRGQVDTLVWFLTVLCGLHAVLGVVTTKRAQITTIGFPPTVLFAAITVFGVLALTTA